MKWRPRVGMSVALATSLAAGTYSSLAKDAVGSPTSSGSDSTGTVGTNGLKPCAYKKFQQQLAMAMGNPFPRDATGTELRNDSNWAPIFTDPGDGRTFVDTVFKCAFQSNGAPPGAGLLGDVHIYQNWLDGGLTASEQQDIHTCLATLMNYHEGVSVWMEGADIKANPGVQREDYPMAEGFWGTAVSLDDPRGATVYFFPPAAAPDENKNKQVDEAFRKKMEAVAIRSCSKTPTLCPIKVVQEGVCIPVSTGGCSSHRTNRDIFDALRDTVRETCSSKIERGECTHALRAAVDGTGGCHEGD